MEKPARYRGSLALLVLLASTSAAPCFGVEPPRLSIDQIIKGMKTAEQLWLSQPTWLIRYRHIREYKNVPAGRTKSYQPRTYVYARRGPDTYLHECIGPGFAQQTWTVWKDHVCRLVTGDALTILPEPASALFEKTYYTNALYLDIYRDYEFLSQDWKDIYRAQSPSEAFFVALPRAIESHRTEIELHSETEVVDGFACHVLERENRDIMWIDTAHGFVCRRRIYYQASGAKFFEQKNEDLVEYPPGLWLPTRQVEHRYYRSDAPGELRNLLASIETNILEKAAFGTVPESLFHVPLTERMLVTDKIRGKRYIKHPRGTDARTAFNIAIERASREMPDTGSDRSALMRPAVILANLIVLGLLLLTYQLKFHRR